MRKRMWLVRGAAAIALLAGTMSVSACDVLAAELSEQQEGGEPDFGDIATAVPAAEPRVLAVEELSRSLDGFSYRLSIMLVMDTPDALSAEELDRVLRAVWEGLSWEPTTVQLGAYVTANGTDEPVAFESAAEELGLRYDRWNDYAGSLRGLEERYGAQ